MSHGRKQPLNVLYMEEEQLLESGLGLTDSVDFHLKVIACNPVPSSSWFPI